MLLSSSDTNIVVMMMFFELFLLRKISEFPSGTRTHNKQRLWVRVPFGNSDIFLSKNSSKNIIIKTRIENVKQLFIELRVIFQAMTHNKKKLKKENAAEVFVSE